MSTGGLYNADGTFVPFNGADLSTELATRQNAGVFSGNWRAGFPPCLTRIRCCASAGMTRKCCRNFPPMTR